jgi:NADPH-dependent 7-cyano-7-deazaguanine reductase QueF
MTRPVAADPATTGPDVAGLSQAVPAEDLPELLAFDGPASLTTATLRVGQLSKVCPANRRPDQFRVELVYRPTNGRCVEIDSFVCYLEGFHHRAVSAEALADQVAAAVLQVTGAGRVEVTVYQLGREGGEIQVTARHPTTASSSSDETARS